MPQPVLTFLRQSLLLKTAMKECLDKPKPGPVHRLRSTTRRIEATLALLVASANLPRLPKSCKAFRRSLRKIRQAAGEVRDLDVHRELLGAYKTIADAADLEKDLRAMRKKKGRVLQRHILKDMNNIQGTLDEIESAVASAVDLNLSGGKLANAAQGWLTPALRGLNPEHDEDLHSIRKACKTARYIAEIGGEASRAAQRLADRLDDIQQSTGAWHDHLVLSHEAQSSLPEGSLLVEKLQTKAEGLRRQAEAKTRRLLTS